MNINGEVNGSPSNCLFKFLHPCVSLRSLLNRNRPIHPLDPIAPKYSEFLVVGHQKKIRVIHLQPRVKTKFENGETKRFSINRNSLSEEYWFTRWNKPLRTGNCNCSFRRSQQFGSNQFLHTVPPDRRSDILSTKITNVETFVERLIQDTLIEAFQAYFMKQSEVECFHNLERFGVDNLGFVKTENESNGVVLRSNLESPAVMQVDCVEKQFNPNQICTHNLDIHSKPVILMLHGIGSSADVWWSIISSLSCKGFEIVAPDMLGHGFSSVPDSRSSYHFKNLLLHTLTIFDHYIKSNESKKCVIIGHSFGCSLATALCHYRSQQIVQLILISGGGPTPLAPPAIDNISSCLQTAIKPLLLCGVKRSLIFSLRGKNFGVCDINNAIPSHILRYIINGQNWPEGDAAFHRRILIPTLLIHGLQDTQITLVQECEMERTIPRAFLEIIPNAGHMSMIDAPEHLTHMIICFVEWWKR